MAGYFPFPKRRVRLALLASLTCLLLTLPYIQAAENNDLPPPPAADPSWNQVYDINGKPVTLGQINSVINQNKPTYGGEIVCSNEEGVCCPAYCCSAMSTVHDLSQTMNMSFREKQTASLLGTFEILSKQELHDVGTFAAVLYKYFEKPVFGGWTLELNFNKPVMDLHSFNAKIVGTMNGARTYYLRPMVWNKNIPPGFRRLLVQGLTTPEKDDGIALTAGGALWFDPNEQAVDLNPPPFVPEPRPVPAPEPVPGERYNLGEALQLSILFYEAQRSGKLPATNRIHWRADSALDDKTDEGKDLTGGWYDAGDFIKLQVPMAYSTTILLWGLIKYPEAYASVKEVDNMREAVRWPLDYFIKAHTKSNELYVQVSDEVDHCYWEIPEIMTYKRRGYKVTCQNPGSQPVMNTASALAAGSIAFKESDPEYSATLLKHATELFAFAEQCPGDYIKDGHIPAQGMYNDGGQYLDEHAFAALWLHKATEQATYLEKAIDYYWQCCSHNQNVDQPYKLLQWADVSMGVNLLLYEATHWEDFAQAITQHLDNFITTVPKTPKGLSYFNDWGANRFAANTAFTALLAADLGLKTGWYREYAASQIYYMLGDCCLDPDTKQATQSHLIGFGPKYPTAPHHRASSCKGTECACTAHPNAHTLWGGLVGGPDKNDGLSTDGCSDFIHNEVATDYNAAFTSAVAALKQLSLSGQLPQPQQHF